MRRRSFPWPRKFELWSVSNVNSRSTHFWLKRSELFSAIGESFENINFSLSGRQSAYLSSFQHWLKKVVMITRRNAVFKTLITFYVHISLQNVFCKTFRHILSLKLIILFEYYIFFDSFFGFKMLLFYDYCSDVRIILNVKKIHNLTHTSQIFWKNLNLVTSITIVLLMINSIQRKIIKRCIDTIFFFCYCRSNNFM